jgi:hypothetical protein
MDVGGGALMPMGWPNDAGFVAMPVADLGIGMLVTGGGGRTVKPAFTTSVHGTAGYIALGIDLRAGFGLVVDRERHRLLLTGGPLAQSAVLVAGARAQGLGGYLETAVLRQVGRHAHAGIRFHVGVTAAVPRREAYTSVTSTVAFVCLLH